MNAGDSVPILSCPLGPSFGTLPGLDGSALPSATNALARLANLGHYPRELQTSNEVQKQVPSFSIRCFFTERVLRSFFF